MEQQNSPLKLFVTRDFGQYFEATFDFLKHNYGAICKGLVFFLPLLLIGSYFIPAAASMPTNTYDMDVSDIWSIYLSIIVAGIFSSLSSFLAMIYTIAYMAEYSLSVDGKVEMSAVWARLKRAFLPLIGGYIVYSIIVVIGAIFCFIPGIYIAVACFFYAYVYINEDQTIIDSLRRSYDIVQNKWWITFLYLLIFGIVIAILSLLFSIPSQIGSLASVFGIDTFASGIVTYITALVANVGEFFISPLIYVAAGILYYSHRNQDENVDMQTNIDNMGITGNQDYTPYQ